MRNLLMSMRTCAVLAVSAAVVLAGLAECHANAGLDSRLHEHIADLSSNGMSGDVVDRQQTGCQVVLCTDADVMSCIADAVMEIEISGQIPESRTDWLKRINEFVSQQGFPAVALFKTDSSGNTFISFDGTTIGAGVPGGTGGTNVTTGATCTNGLICTSIADCTTHTDCTKANDCTNHGECTKGIKCTSGVCTKGDNCTLGTNCTKGDLCTASTACTAGTDCTNSDNNSCTKGGNCTDGDYCTNGNNFCTSGGNCTKDDSCTSTTNCSNGRDCTLGTKCSLRGNCTAGTNCSNGTNCTKGQFCSAGGDSACTSGPNCSSTANCTKGQFCSSGAHCTKAKGGANNGPKCSTGGSGTDKCTKGNDVCSNRASNCTTHPDCHQVTVGTGGCTQSNGGIPCPLTVTSISSPGRFLVAHMEYPLALGFLLVGWVIRLPSADPPRPDPESS